MLIFSAQFSSGNAATEFMWSGRFYFRDVHWLQVSLKLSRYCKNKMLHFWNTCTNAFIRLGAEDRREIPLVRLYRRVAYRTSTIVGQRSGTSTGNVYRPRVGSGRVG